MNKSFYIAYSLLLCREEESFQLNQQKTIVALLYSFAFIYSIRAMPFRSILFNKLVETFLRPKPMRGEKQENKFETAKKSRECEKSVDQAAWTNELYTTLGDVDIANQRKPKNV